MSPTLRSCGCSFRVWNGLEWTRQGGLGQGERTAAARGGLPAGPQEIGLPNVLCGHSASPPWLFSGNLSAIIFLSFFDFVVSEWTSFFFLEQLQLPKPQSLSPQHGQPCAPRSLLEQSTCSRSLWPSHLPPLWPDLNLHPFCSGKASDVCPSRLSFLPPRARS